MKNTPCKNPFWNSRPFKKASLAVFTVILTLVALEIILRMVGFAILSAQEYRNRQAIKQTGRFRVLCLGESTTQNQYPPYLEEILNKRQTGIKFNVIDKGLAGVTTTTVLSNLESNLDKYKPDIVVTMMGCNDYKTLYYLDIPESDTGIFKNCRLYRFARIIYMDICKKINKQDIYSLKADKNHRSLKTAQPANKTDSGNLENEYKKLAKFADFNKYTGRGYGIKYIDRERAGELEQILKRIISLTPGNDQAYTQLSMLYWQEGRFNEAEQLLIHALEINPRAPATHIQIGRVYRDHGEFVKSEQAFKEALKLAPGNFSAYGGLEWLYRHQERFDERNQILKKVMELSPQNDEEYTTLGSIYNYFGEFAKAKNAYMKAIELNPRKDQAYAGLGSVYEKERDFPSAEAAYEKAVEIAPDNDPAFMELYWVYREQGKNAEAEKTLRRAIECNPRNDLAIGGLAVKYLESDKPDLARQYSERVNNLRREFYNSVTANNYHRLKLALDKRGIKLVCAQYPMRSIAILRKMLKDEPKNSIIFVDNERSFKDAVAKEGYNIYFTDMFGGDFGHCTEKGNRLLAANIADAILKDVFGK